MDLLLIRHGRPQRVELAVGEVADPPLAALGHAQARALARWLADEPIDAIYTSPMLRARETAVPLVEATGIAPVVVDAISEFDRANHYYVPLEEMLAENDPRLAEIAEGKLFEQAGITAESFRATVAEAIESIVGDNPGRTVAVVCHGGVINAWFGHVTGLEDFMFMVPTYTGISRYRCSSRGHRTVVSVNETAHLRGVVG